MQEHRRSRGKAMQSNVVIFDLAGLGALCQTAPFNHEGGPIPLLGECLG